MSESASAELRGRDTPKSRRTRARILDTAMRLFAEAGVVDATNPKIAEAAELTRGAMLYHFPDRQSLIAAAAAHVQAAREVLFRQAHAALPRGADAVDEAIDAYWRLLQTQPFRAFMELEAAARTDPQVAEAIRPAQAAFDRSGVGGPLLGFLQAGRDPRFQASRDLARFALEGLARTGPSYEREARVQAVIRVVKRAAHMLNRKGDVHDLWD